MMTNPSEDPAGAAPAQPSELDVRLRHAVVKCEADEVRALIAAGADPNVIDAEGVALLVRAVNAGLVDEVRAMVEGGADVNAESKNPRPDRDFKGPVTPLLVSMIRGHRPITAYLTPLTDRRVLKRARKQFRLVRRKRGRRDPAFKRFLAAAEAGDVDAVAAAILGGVDVDAGDEFHGNTALMLAAMHGHTEVVRLLLAARADPNIESPLTAARNTAIAAALIRAGADVNHYDELIQVTPLHSALLDRLDVMGLLIEAGADPDLQTGPHGCALSTDCAHGWVESALLLIEAGADVNNRPKAKDRWDDTWPPLMYAAASGKVPIVKALLAAGADWTVRGWDGETALSLASENGHSAVVDILKQAGADA
jgi:ankyrin repeat protein